MENQTYSPYQNPAPAQSAQPPLSFGNRPPITPTIGQTTTPPEAGKPSRKEQSRLIGLIIASVFAVIFLGLFIWTFVNWMEVKTDVDGQVNKAVAVAVDDKVKELEDEFAEREKSPFSTFAGPVEYGGLTFQYPKTWSLYIARDASSSGDYEAYLNPGAVNPISNTTINSLRISILDRAFDVVTKSYENNIKAGKLTPDLRVVGGENANIYVGTLPGGNFVGAAAVFPIRDKTVVLQTDASVFSDDFYTILDTVQYNR